MTFAIRSIREDRANTFDGKKATEIGFVQFSPEGPSSRKERQSPRKLLATSPAVLRYTKEGLPARCAS